jgi:DNA-binding transcriptional LysR family regulator
VPSRDPRPAQQRLRSDFPKRYPGLSVGITSSHKDANLVEEGLDLAIRIGVLEDSPLVVRKLANLRGRPHMVLQPGSSRQLD